MSEPEASWPELAARFNAWLDVALAAPHSGAALLRGAWQDRQALAEAARAVARAARTETLRAAAQGLATLASIEPAGGFDAWEAAADAEREAIDIRRAVDGCRQALRHVLAALHDGDPRRGGLQAIDDRLRQLDVS